MPIFISPLEWVMKISYCISRHALSLTMLALFSTHCLATVLG